MSDPTLASLLFLGVGLLTAAVAVEAVLVLVVVVGICVLPAVLALTLIGNLAGRIGDRARERRLSATQPER